MNIKTRALTQEEYFSIVDTINKGFVYNDKTYLPNSRIATALVLEANSGLRIGDIMQIRLSDIYMQNGKYKLRVKEKKTNKLREVYISNDLYILLQRYALESVRQRCSKKRLDRNRKSA